MEEEPAPTATLTADPVSIQEGNESTLTHSCTNSTSASITSIGSVTPSAPPGAAVSVSPASDTTYTLTCSGPGGSDTASVTVQVTPRVPQVDGSCSVSPGTIDPGGTATWQVTPTGGNGTYTYQWSGDDNLSGNTASVSHTYQNPGTYTASVRVTSAGMPQTIICDNSLTVTAPPPPPPTEEFTPPSNGSASCNTGGTQARLSWSPGSNADYYYVRVSRVGSCPAGWQQHPGESSWCTPDPDRVNGTSITYPTAPGQNYSYWIFTSHSGGAALNPPLTGSFSCSGPQEPQEPDPPGSSSLSCSVNNNSPAVGERVTFTASGASSPYTWDPQEPGEGPYSGGATTQRTYDAPGSYVMEVSKNGSSKTCPLVTVGPLACTGATASIEASPDRVRVRPDGDGLTRVTWSASGIDTSCLITGTNGYSNRVSANACVLPGGGASFTTEITTQTTFVINCDDGEARDEVVVNVIPKFTEF